MPVSILIYHLISNKGLIFLPPKYPFLKRDFISDSDVNWILYIWGCSCILLTYSIRVDYRYLYGLLSIQELYSLRWVRSGVPPPRFGAPKAL